MPLASFETSFDWRYASALTSARSTTLQDSLNASREEWQFLIACVATQCAGGDSAAPMPDAAGLDWNTILRLAEAHRVMPLLSSAVLANQVKSASPEIAADLKGRFRYYAQKGMTFVIELRVVLGALRQAGIRCLPLKGPVLTMGSYRKLGLRDFDDLDLLVAPADVTRAVAILAKLGYVGWDVPHRWIEPHLRSESEHNLVCVERKITVDLHWGIGRKYFTMPMDFQTLWDRSVRTKLIGSEVPDLSAEDAVLFLCYHGGKHLFGRLTWVCDVAATIAAHPNLDWDALLDRASQMGARRLLLLGVCLARDMLGSNIPDRIKQLIPTEPKLKPLVAMVLRGIFDEADSESKLKEQIKASLFHLRVRERMSDRLRYLLWAAAPNARDWRDSHVPRSLSFLLVLTRPFRLLRNSRAQLQAGN